MIWWFRKFGKFRPSLFLFSLFYRHRCPIFCKESMYVLTSLAILFSKKLRSTKMSRLSPQFIRVTHAICRGEVRCHVSDKTRQIWWNFCTTYEMRVGGYEHVHAPTYAMCLGNSNAHAWIPLLSLCLGQLQEEDAHVLSFRRSWWLESHLLNVLELGSGFRKSHREASYDLITIRLALFWTWPVCFLVFSISWSNCWRKRFTSTSIKWALLPR